MAHVSGTFCCILARNAKKLSSSFLFSPLKSEMLRQSSYCVARAFVFKLQSNALHTSSELCRKHGGLPEGPKRWGKYNEVVWSPQKDGEPRRNAEVFHFRDNIKYSPKKMWYLACWVRGMSVDEAVKQLSFHPKKGAHVIKEILLEAQELAVRDHNVEYKSNLWIAESFVGKGIVVKGLRRHARARYGTLHYRYCHYFVKLAEGSPPAYYYKPEPTGWEYMEDYLHEWRSRTVHFGQQAVPGIPKHPRMRPREEEY